MPSGRDPDPDDSRIQPKELPELLASVIVEEDSDITAGEFRFCEPLKAFVDDILPESLPAESLGDCKMREVATPAIVPAHHGGDDSIGARIATGQVQTPASLNSQASGDTTRAREVQLRIPASPQRRAEASPHPRQSQASRGGPVPCPSPVRAASASPS